MKVMCLTAQGYHDPYSQNDANIGSSKRRPENFTPELDLNPDHSNTSAVLYHLSHKANWELVIRLVLDNPKKLLQVTSSQSTL